MEQLSGPKTAAKPNHVEWPEVQPLADDASVAYARTMQATVVASFLTARGWKEQVNEETGHYERSTGLMLYVNRRGGALVKGADGEDGVCFQFSCSLVQQKSDGSWQAPFLDCEDYSQQKVTCKSVAKFSRPASVAVKPKATPEPAQKGPFGRYRGNANVKTTKNAKTKEQTAQSELTLIDLGGDKVEVVTGACHITAKRTRSTIRIAAGTCSQGSMEAKVKGTLELLDGGELDVDLEMTIVMNGQTTALKSSGVLALE
jgi:hypothetical protein